MATKSSGKVEDIEIQGWDIPVGSFGVDVVISPSSSTSSSGSSESSESSCTFAVIGLLLFLFPTTDSDWFIFDFFCTEPG